MTVIDGGQRPGGQRTQTGQGSGASIRALRLGPVSIRLNLRLMVVAALLTAGLVAAMALHIAFGGTPLPYPDVLRALFGDASSPPDIPCRH